MSDPVNSEQLSQDVDNGTADAWAATAIITLVVIGAIHFIYTGGLPAFIANVL